MTITGQVSSTKRNDHHTHAHCTQDHHDPDDTVMPIATTASMITTPR